MFCKRLIAGCLAVLCCLSAVSCGKPARTASKAVSSSSSAASGASSASDGSDTGTSSQTAPSGTGSTVSAAQQAPSQAASSSAPRVTVTVTIPEGFSVPQIAERLQASGVCSEADFLSAVNHYPFTEASLGAIPYDSSKMCFRLEGYLFPDTYQFYQNMKAQDAIGKMLANADSRIVGKYSFQTVILASIIEKEIPDPTGMKNVSSVFHNRLNDTRQFPFLGSDATVKYLTTYIHSVDAAMGSDLVDTYKYYYNTDNRVHGLPAGPICNPGLQALDAAANPANTNYLYFASDAGGNYTFSATPLPGASS